MNYKDKVDLVRENIISNAQVYKNKLAGRYYLYIFENHSFEMYFGTDNYMHLTGVGSRVSPEMFYDLANKNHLQASQIFFSSRFPLRTAIQKTSNLSCLPDFTTEGYFVVKDLVTDTETYPYAITNIDQSVLIGLKEEDGAIYIPKSFRIRGKVFERAEDDKLFEVNFILCKTDKAGLYNRVLYRDHTNWETLDKDIVDKIDKDVLESYKKEI